MALGLRERMKEQKKDLQKRRETQQQDKAAGRWGSVFDRNKVPSGRQFWACKEGSHIVDVIPFAAGPNFPPLTRVKENEVEYRVDLWAHQGVGPTDEQFVCPAFMFKKPCPICEYLAEEKAAGRRLPKEEYSAIRAKNRTIYLVWIHDTPEDERKGIQIWEVASFFFQDKLDEIARDPRGRGMILFEDLDIGKNISFRKKNKGDKQVEYTGHQFLDRDVPIPDNIVEQSFSLDTIIKWESDYDEMYKLFHQSRKGLEGGAPKRTQPEEDRPAEKEQSAEDPEPETQQQLAEEPEPETQQVTNEEQAATSTHEKVPQETQEGKPICPGGGTFGLDIDKLDMCANQCDIWDDCDAENVRIKQAVASKPKEKPKEKKEGAKPKLRRRNNG